MQTHKPQNTKKKRGRPPSQKADGPETIKKAALFEFAKYGYKGASIEKISQAAGVAKPLVHYHFASKSELWTQVVSEAFDSLQDQIQKFSIGFVERNPANVIDQFALAIVRFSAENYLLIRISTDETRQGGERADWLKHTYLLPLHKVAISLLNTISLKESGNYEPNSSAHIIPSIFGAINFPFIDADVVSEAYEVNVFSESYITEQAKLIAMLIWACIHNYK